MTQEEFFRICRLFQTKYGIDLSRKKEIVCGRMENFLRNGGYRSYTDYLDAVEHDYTGNMEKELVNILTTNHTYFMREFAHFEYLRREVLPWLRRREADRKDLRIWCGASSTGEEPYMMAMLLKDFFGPEHNLWDTKILATDISTEVLRHALAGIYTKEQTDVLLPQWRKRFLQPVDGGMKYEITDEIKREVIFRQFNLMDPFPFKRKMHIVLLRNVMIYFDQPTKRQLIRKVYDIMEPGGYLFIGRTETIDRTSSPFQLIQPSIFRKQGKAGD